MGMGESPTPTGTGPAATGGAAGRWVLRAVAAWVGVGAVVSAVSVLSSCSSKPPPLQTSISCLTCHQEIHAAWAGTDHALANRLVTPDDEPVLATFPVEGEAAPKAILGSKPLWQPLIPGDGGRLQPHEIAYDPEKHEWFNVFGDENRRPGEWGHWTGRGMNWNSMCAHCHMTDFQKGYNPAADSYTSTWLEQGIGCVQCHGHVDRAHVTPGYKSPPPAPDGSARRTAMETCAPCHARNEILATGFKPGDRYEDFYRITLPVEPGVYWPDGQQRDEDFNWTSVLLSRMAHAGVTCMDCHDPHTTRTLLPVANNAICMQCHADPGRIMPGGTQAKPIDPTSHSRHKADSTGNLCVECHMPRATYMQRAPRHDHGWLSPDPLMTKELGIPNACSSCHKDKDLEWSIRYAEEWYGGKLAGRQRERARAIAAAQQGNPESVGKLLSLLKDEDIPAWRATYLQSLAPFAGAVPSVSAAAREALTHDNPMVRASGAQLLSGDASARAVLRPLLEDPVRLVRLDAAWALSDEIPSDAAVRKEFDAYLRIQEDQPAGQLKIGQDLANRGRFEEALVHMDHAGRWDPYSPGIFEAKGMMLSAMGRPAEAGAALFRAGMLNRASAVPMFRAGLAFAEAGMQLEATNALGAAVQRDPNMDRAWYNLGLLRSQQGDIPGAIDALSKAEAAASQVPDYPYAAATIHLRAGDRAAALEAVRRTLSLDPGHTGARELMRSLQ